MSTAVITFDEMERKSKKAMGWTLLAKSTRSKMKATVLLGFVSGALKRLVSSLTPEELEKLSSEQAIQLTEDLQELHTMLASFCTMPGMEQVHRRRIVGKLMASITEGTEDLGDIIEDLVLSENDHFKLLVSECVQGISTAARSGRM